MPRKEGKARLSPREELLLGIILIPIAIIFLWSNLGYAVMGIVSIFGVVLVVHALWRFVRRDGPRRRIGTGTMLVLVVLLSGAAWLSFPTSSHAAVAGSVHGGGQWNAPTTPIKGWWDTHTANDSPPIGCRTGSGWTEGTYPSLVLDLGPPPSFSWRKTYIFGMRMKVCWTAKGLLGLDRKFVYWHVIRPSFSEVDTSLIQNPRYDRTEAAWDPDAPGCLNIRVKGLATLVPIPVPGVKEILPIVGAVIIHFWVDFKDVCTDGTTGDVIPDDYPY